MPTASRLAALGLLALLGLGPGPRAIAAEDPSPPLGHWLSQDQNGVFEIRQCGPVLCGRLVGMRYAGAMPTDNTGQPQCGLMMLTGFVREADDRARWDGMILDPEHGRRYHATIWSPEPGLLDLRGYLLLPLFGRTEHWTRYDGAIGPECRLPG